MCVKAMAVQTHPGKGVGHVKDINNFNRHVWVIKDQCEKGPCQDADCTFDTVSKQEVVGQRTCVFCYLVEQ